MSLCLPVNIGRGYLAVKPFWHRLPVEGQVHHVPRIQHPVPEQVVELEAGPVELPRVLLGVVVQLVPLGGEHHQMLHVSPRQRGAAQQSNGPMTSI